VLAYCWAYARRKLYELATLYQVEKDIRGLSAEARLKAQQDRSAPLITTFTTY